MDSKPKFINHRLQLWDQWQQQYKDLVSQKQRLSIQVTLTYRLKTEKNTETVEAIAWESTPYLLVKSKNQSQADNSVIAKVNGELWDLDRPLEDSCSLEVLDFEDPDGRYVFWHSSAHILGEAMELHYHGNLCYGPPVDEGFYYDIHLIDDRKIVPEDFKDIEDRCKRIVKEKQKFERLEVTIEQLKEMFDYNIFKCRILDEKVDTPTTTIYRCGDLIDLCRGPHVRNTGKIKAMSVTKNSASYWEGKAEMESLQRLYGISFPEKKQLDEWKAFQEEAAKRDHRKIGVRQKLYFFHELSPGSAFFEPKGNIIYDKLINLIKSEYRKRGFDLVTTPNIYNSKLWEVSGHWQHYAENMFQTDIEKQKFALKPMNCPGHCLMFKNRLRSYKELPLRLADFGVLHRNEASGALTGLTRVRRFQQDDAHIFCREDQITQEIRSALEFMALIYNVFGFEFKLYLSTRPEKFLGEIGTWDRAEAQLKTALNGFGRPWQENPGDGAFYGPKIDITITDALRRSHQCATIQLDFQLPERFDLSYMVDVNEVSGDEKKTARPVIIHRAILGSVERMIAILTESYGGKWPFWLSPYQAIVISCYPSADEYAKSVRDRIDAAGFECDIDIDEGTVLNKKIFKAQDMQYNFILVVGKGEQDKQTVNVRRRGIEQKVEVSVEDLLHKFDVLQSSRAINAEQLFG